MALEDLSMDELQAEFVRLGNELSITAGKRQDILKFVHKRKEEAAAAVRLGRLTAVEKDALRAALGDPE